MLEVCQKKHMLLGLTLLVALTICVLIIESRLDISGPARKPQFVIENNSTCWLREKYTVIQECHKCSEFDLVSRSLGVCVQTKYKELLRCDNSGEIVIKSCDRIVAIDQKNFVHFEVCCFVFGLLTYFLSFARHRILSRRTHQKLERQLNRT
ncbi:jumping translocation breakpoint protein JTBR [Musca autumnalis]|uniref:jumping translocation breakpoint protein JTBR n=1 Tax=Musca autumnalis TaxID=221902 RepID=UPI003CF0C19F